MGWTEDRRALDLKLADHRQRRAALDKEWQSLREQEERLTARRLEATTDEEFLADADARQWLVLQAWGDGKAANRLETLANIGHPCAWLKGYSYDPRSEVPHGAHLAPYLGMKSRTTDAELERLARVLGLWWEVWGYGREDTYVDFIEAGLSERNSWAGVWTPATDTFVITDRRYREEYSGPLLGGLAWMRDHHPMSTSPGDEGYEEDEAAREEAMFDRW